MCWSKLQMWSALALLVLYVSEWRLAETSAKVTTADVAVGVLVSSCCHDRLISLIETGIHDNFDVVYFSDPGSASLRGHPLFATRKLVICERCTSAKESLPCKTQCLLERLYDAVDDSARISPVGKQGHPSEARVKSHGKDWFVRLMDDSFLLEDNLLNELSRYSADEAIVLGDKFTVSHLHAESTSAAPQGHNGDGPAAAPSDRLAQLNFTYPSGGPGWAISRAAMDKLLSDRSRFSFLMQTGEEDPRTGALLPPEVDDMRFGLLCSYLGVPVLPSCFSQVPLDIQRMYSTCKTDGSMSDFSDPAPLAYPSEPHTRKPSMQIGATGRNKHKTELGGDEGELAETARGHITEQFFTGVCIEGGRRRYWVNNMLMTAPCRSVLHSPCSFHLGDETGGVRNWLKYLELYKSRVLDGPYQRLVAGYDPHVIAFEGCFAGKLRSASQETEGTQTSLDHSTQTYARPETSEDSQIHKAASVTTFVNSAIPDSHKGYAPPTVLDEHLSAADNVDNVLTGSKQANHTMRPPERELTLEVSVNGHKVAYAFDPNESPLEVVGRFLSTHAIAPPRDGVKRLLQHVLTMVGGGRERLQQGIGEQKHLSHVSASFGGVTDEITLERMAKSRWGVSLAHPYNLQYVRPSWRLPLRLQAVLRSQSWGTDSHDVGASFDLLPEGVSACLRVDEEEAVFCKTLKGEDDERTRSYLKGLVPDRWHKVGLWTNKDRQTQADNPTHGDRQRKEESIGETHGDSASGSKAILRSSAYPSPDFVVTESRGPRGAPSELTTVYFFVQAPTHLDLLLSLIDKFGYTSYLEIGTYKDECFSRIPLADKVGVDPEQGGGLRMTSDAFFAQNARTFDLIFIDGLHHAEQVHRDIANSLRSLNEGGTIVLHDCSPSSEIMQAVPRRALEWTGDVWKAVAAFRTRSDLDIVVGDFDYGCGLVRRAQNSLPIVLNKPYSELTWSDYLQHRQEILRPTSFVDIERWLEASSSVRPTTAPVSPASTSRASDVNMHDASGESTTGARGASTSKSSASQTSASAPPPVRHAGGAFQGLPSLVMVLDAHGLANRLRALASGWVLARETGRKLFVNWEPSAECNATFADLFVNHVDSEPQELRRCEWGRSDAVCAGRTLQSWLSSVSTPTGGETAAGRATCSFDTVETPPRVARDRDYVPPSAAPGGSSFCSRVRDEATATLGGQSAFVTASGTTAATGAAATTSGTTTAGTTAARTDANTTAAASWIDNDTDQEIFVAEPYDLPPLPHLRYQAFSWGPNLSAVADLSIDVVSITSGGDFRLPGMDCQRYIELKRRFYRSLRPRAEVLALADEVWSRVLHETAKEMQGERGTGRDLASGLAAAPGTRRTNPSYKSASELAGGGGRGGDAVGGESGGENAGGEEGRGGEAERGEARRREARGKGRRNGGEGGDGGTGAVAATSPPTQVQVVGVHVRGTVDAVFDYANVPVMHSRQPHFFNATSPVSYFARLMREITLGSERPSENAEGLDEDNESNKNYEKNESIQNARKNGRKHNTDKNEKKEHKKKRGTNDKKEVNEHNEGNNANMTTRKKRYEAKSFEDEAEEEAQAPLAPSMSSSSFHRRHAPAVVFLLASNDERVEAQLRNLTADCCNIVSARGFEGRKSVDGMRQALAEWILLGRTDLVLGSFWSSFSDEAAVAGDILKVMVRRGTPLADAHWSAPGCGMGGHPSVNLEFGGVSIDGSAPCASLQSAWGLSGVYSKADDPACRASNPRFTSKTTKTTATLSLNFTPTTTETASEPSAAVEPSFTATEPPVCPYDFVLSSPLPGQIFVTARGGRAIAVSLSQPVPAGMSLSVTVDASVHYQAEAATVNARGVLLRVEPPGTHAVAASLRDERGITTCRLPPVAFEVLPEPYPVVGLPDTWMAQPASQTQAEMQAETQADGEGSEISEGFLFPGVDSSGDGGHLHGQETVAKAAKQASSQTRRGGGDPTLSPAPPPGSHGKGRGLRVLHIGDLNGVDGYKTSLLALFRHVAATDLRQTYLDLSCLRAEEGQPMLSLLQQTPVSVLRECVTLDLAAMDRESFLRAKAELGALSSLAEADPRFLQAVRGILRALAETDVLVLTNGARQFDDYLLDLARLAGVPLRVVDLGPLGPSELSVSPSLNAYLAPSHFVASFPGVRDARVPVHVVHPIVDQRKILRVLTRRGEETGEVVRRLVAADGSSWGDSAGAENSYSRARESPASASRVVPSKDVSKAERGGEQEREQAKEGQGQEQQEQARAQATGKNKGQGSIRHPRDEIRITFAGRVASQKGPGMFIRAAALLAAQVRRTGASEGRGPARAHFTMIGDGPLLPTMRQLATSLSVEMNFTGFVAPAEMPFALAEADVLVFPSLFPEALGVVSIEAMMLGVPVVSFGIGGAGEYCIHDRTCVLVEERTAPALANALMDLLEDPPKIRVLGQQAQEFAHRVFGLNVTTRRYVSVLRRLYEDAVEQAGAESPSNFCSAESEGHLNLCKLQRTGSAMS